MMIGPPILTRDELDDAWPALSRIERIEGFSLLPRHEAEEMFLAIDPTQQLELLEAMSTGDQRIWVRLLPPDDAADLLQAEPDRAAREALLAMLDAPMRHHVTALMAYDEDDAGGLMNPRYYRLRPEMQVDEAIAYLRVQIRQSIDAVHYAYVLDSQQKLLGVLPFRELIRALPDRIVADVMNKHVVTVPDDMDQEEVSRLIGRHNLIALPVVDAEGRMKGVVTADDVLDVMEEEVTEDIHKLGGVSAFEMPYLDIPIGRMIRNRVGWLAILFLGETFTATAMAFFEDEIARAVVLAVFIPLIVSSGGNSGSQTATLVIRAMALGQVRLRDWVRVLRREAVTGMVLGGVLAALALIRVLAWEGFHRAVYHAPLYGEHYMLIAIVVAGSLVGVVLWGSVIGCVLPLILSSLRFDPASASTPFVATLVDVVGVMIYLSTAALVLHGTLL